MGDFDRGVFVGLLFKRTNLKPSDAEALLYEMDRLFRRGGVITMTEAFGRGGVVETKRKLFRLAKDNLPRAFEGAVVPPSGIEGEL